MFDFDAYAGRIGLDETPDLAALHLAHTLNVPFENFASREGLPVSLALEDLVEKIVTNRRGGYCFEQNLLLKAAFEELGAHVELILARVRLGRPADKISPRSHLILRVDFEGRRWHADVGFGPFGLWEPVPFAEPGEFEQLGWHYRLVAQGEEFVLQLLREGVWADLYAYLPRPVPLVDVETSNWFVSTHPSTPFVTGLVACLNRADGTRIALSDWWSELALIENTPTQSVNRALVPEEVGALLETHFGLGGFVLDAAGRLSRPGARDL